MGIQPHFGLREVSVQVVILLIVILSIFLREIISAVAAWRIIKSGLPPFFFLDGLPSLYSKLRCLTTYLWFPSMVLLNLFDLTFDR